MLVRRLVLRRTGLVILGGLLFGAAVGPTVLPSASSAQAQASNAPCTSTSYVLTLSFADPTTTAWSISVSGQVDFTNHAATANLTLSSSFPVSFLAGTNLEVELVGGTAYVSVPPALSGFVNGATWVSITLPSTLGGALDSIFPRLAQWCGNGQSFVGALGRHRAGSSLGTSSLAGVAVSGTQVHSTSKRVNKALGLPGLTGTRPHRLGNSRVPIDVWDNAQGQLAELSISMPSVSITLELTNIDQPVSITAPAGAVPLSPSLLGLLTNYLHFNRTTH